MSNASLQPGSAVDARLRKRVFASTFVGNVVEYYDFTLYGTLAAVVATHFFPKNDTVVGLLVAYVGVLLSYLIRPLAGLVLGPLADKRGRKTILVTTLFLMTIGTAGIGVLPTYAAAGVVAPVLLLLSRILQGVGASVEYTTAANFLFEHERGRRRNYISGVINASSSVGSLFAALVAFLCTSVLPAATFNSWGWRIPFLIAIPVAAIGFYIRNRLDETPDFKKMQQVLQERQAKQTPLRTLFRYYWRDMLKAIGLGAGQRVGSVIIQAYFVTALITAGFPVGQSLLVSIATYVIGPFPSVWGGVLGDKYGARVPLVVGYGAFIVLSIPTFLAINSGSIVVAGAAVVVFTVINNLLSPPLNVAYILTFPAEIRATAGAWTFNVGTAAIGGTAALIAVWLNSITGSNLAFAVYLTAVCVISLLVSLFALPAVVNDKTELDLVAKHHSDSGVDAGTPAASS
ncbi:MFS transporter [Amycolatopsis sp.]|uniref:MFS transporter n=1 Tax=Amycolatopsis sp. TaxID=37632 RepID=UPI002C08A2B1|nr:MFS transporter [Amycolatopsis sp.]HVV11453.1 MFS transporter [Amycolatopsis sp.]